MSIARLMKHEDIEAYAALRREMLVDSPWSFGADPEVDRASTSERVMEWFVEPSNDVVVVDHPDERGVLCSVAGIRRDPNPKFAHRAGIWGVYTTPGMRGRGYCRLAMEGAIKLAQSWDGVEVIGIGVSANAPIAKALYESLGFVEWGVEPYCLRVDGETYDEHYLSLSV